MNPNQIFFFSSGTAKHGNIRVKKVAPNRRDFRPDLMDRSPGDLSRQFHSVDGRSEKKRPMSYYALFYYVVDDFVLRRSRYRNEHLRLAREASLRGELLLAGAIGYPPDSALLVFRAAERHVAEDFARRDPYVTHGLVTRWEVRPWTVVIGNEPSHATRFGASQ
jgi:uncharacterized protein